MKKTKQNEAPERKMDRLIRHFNDKIHRQCFGFRVSISPTLISFMLKHERPKSLWTKQVCDGNQYGGHKLGVGAIILVCRMLIKVMRIIRMVPMMVTRVLEIQATMTVATSITSDDVFRCFYPGRHPETSRKHRKRRKIIDKQLDILKTPQFTH